MAETKCRRTPCENPAAYRVFWPNHVIGVHEPMLLCAPCAESDKRIGAAWGYYVFADPMPSATPHGGE